MSRAVTLRMTAARGASVALAMGAFSATWGQTLSDPTRPPPAWIAAHAKAPAPGSPGGASVAPGTMAGDGANAEPLPRLQSLLLGPSRKYAIIEGQLVGVGDTFRDARVVAVRSTGVVLRSERGTQTLRLFPDVEKRPVKPVAADAGRAPAKAKRRVLRIGGIGDNVAKEKK
jgi:hypothetical protein